MDGNTCTMALAKRQKIIVVFSFLIQFCVALNIQYFTGTGNETQENITEKCIVDIITSKTLFGSVLLVVSNDLLPNELLREIHSLSNVKVHVEDYKAQSKVIPTTYLVYVPNDVIGDLIDKIGYREPSALYIVVVKDVTVHDLINVFKLLWEYHFVHVLVIVYNDIEDAVIYTYFPYAEGQCGRDYSNIVKLCNCRDVRDIDIIEKFREYDKPILKNCTLNVATRNYPPLVFCNSGNENKLDVGIERFLVELLLERENIALNYTCLPETEDVGNISDNMTVTGMLEMLYEKEVDLLFGGFSVNNRRAALFDFICAHLAYVDTYVPATPRADLMERWKMVYIMFHTNVWLLLLLIFVLCAILLSDFSNKWIISGIDKNMLELLNLFGNATQNIALALREKLFKNFVIIHWLWFIFLMNCFYQTRLTSFTTYRLYKPQLNQYLSLSDYNFTPCLPDDMLLFLKSSGQVPIVNEKYADKDNCKTGDLALDEVAKSTNKYTVTMYLQYLWWVGKNPEEKSRIYLMNENFYNNLYAVFFKRGFPLLDEFNAKMLRLPEHGFVEGAKNFHGIPRDIGRNNNVAFFHTSLTLADLLVPFCILLSGTVFALVVFVVELLHKTKIRVLDYNAIA